MRSTTELSQQLRQAGYPLGPANISEHEAIAATQAAIWYLTNGLALDTRPLNVPVAVHRAPGPVLTFEFDGQPQLGGYSVWTASDSAVSCKLQKSANGVDWQDVSGSQLTDDAGKGRHQRTLGVGSTLVEQQPRPRRTRLPLLPAHRRRQKPARTENRPRPLLADRYSPLPQCRSRRAPLQLPARRRRSRHRSETDEPVLVDTDATAGSELVGPFQVRIPLTLNVTDGHTLVDADGFAIDDIVQPGTDFYLRRSTGHLGDDADRDHPAQTHRHGC